MKNYDPNFRQYLLKNYPEHAHKILKSNSSAWFSRIFYPLFFFLIPIACFIIIAFFVYCIKQPDLFILNSQDKISHILENVTLKNSLLSISITGLIISIISFIIGLFIGFSRANFVLFEGEKLEINVKKLWLKENSLQVEVNKVQNPSTSCNSNLLSTPLNEPEI